MSAMVRALTEILIIKKKCDLQFFLDGAPVDYTVFVMVFGGPSYDAAQEEACDEEECHD